MHVVMVEHIKGASCHAQLGLASLPALTAVLLLAMLVLQVHTKGVGAAMLSWGTCVMLMCWCMWWMPAVLQTAKE